MTAVRSNKQVEPRMPTGTILKRGQVWWAFDERIPLVILSADGMADIQAMRVVAPASTNIQGYADEVPIGVLEGLPSEGVLRVAFPRPGYINCHWLVTLTRADLVEYAAHLYPFSLYLCAFCARQGLVCLARSDRRGPHSPHKAFPTVRPTPE